MSEVNRRYFDNLLAARGWSLRELARQMGMSHSQLSLALNGARKFQLDEVAKISTIFGEPVATVIENAGVSVKPMGGRRASVVGAMRGDGTVEMYGPDVVERTGAPDELPDNVVAIQARTTGSPLEWLDGAVVFFREPNGVDPAALGRLSFCKIKDGPAALASIRRGYRENTYNLFAPYHAESVHLEWASPALVTRN